MKKILFIALLLFPSTAWAAKANVHVDGFSVCGSQPCIKYSYSTTSAKAGGGVYEMTYDPTATTSTTGANLKSTAAATANQADSSLNLTAADFTISGF